MRYAGADGLPIGEGESIGKDPLVFRLLPIIELLMRTSCGVPLPVNGASTGAAADVGVAGELLVTVPGLDRNDLSVRNVAAKRREKRPINTIILKDLVRVMK